MKQESSFFFDETCNSLLSILELDHIVAASGRAGAANAVTIYSTDSKQIKNTKNIPPHQLEREHKTHRRFQGPLKTHTQVT